MKILLAAPSFKTLQPLVSAVVCAHSEPVIARNGVDVIDLIRAGCIDVAALSSDLVDPFCFDVIDIVRRKPPAQEEHGPRTTPLLFLSEDGDEHDMAAALEFGANACVDMRSFDAQAFIAQLEALRRPRTDQDDDSPLTFFPAGSV